MLFRHAALLLPKGSLAVERVPRVADGDHLLRIGEERIKVGVDLDNVDNGLVEALGGREARRVNGTIGGADAALWRTSVMSLMRRALASP